MSENAARKSANKAKASPSSDSLASRRCGCGTHTPGGGSCAECAKRGRGDLSTIRIGAIDDPLEHEADRAASALARPDAGFAGTPVHGSASPSAERIDTPPALMQTLSSPGLPLDRELRDEFESRYATSLSRVRVHHDSAADASNRELGAQAYSFNDHIAFAAGRYDTRSNEGRQLIAHELAHVAQARHGEPVLRRKPDPAKTATPAKPKADAKSEETPEQTWGRLQIFASGMDLGAQILAKDAKPTFRGAEGRTPVYIGLHPSFIKVYDKDGKAITGKLQLKKVKGLTFVPGVYVHLNGIMTAVTVDNSNKHIDVEGGPSVVATRTRSAEEQTKAAEEAKKEVPKDGKTPAP
ncbi:MAG: DUF4157 domain-containing protein, partial [Lysobacter sp.]